MTNPQIQHLSDQEAAYFVGSYYIDNISRRNYARAVFKTAALVRNFKRSGMLSRKSILDMSVVPSKEALDDFLFMFRQKGVDSSIRFELGQVLLAKSIFPVSFLRGNALLAQEVLARRAPKTNAKLKLNRHKSNVSVALESWDDFEDISGAETSLDTYEEQRERITPIATRPQQQAVIAWLLTMSSNVSSVPVEKIADRITANMNKDYAEEILYQVDNGDTQGALSSLQLHMQDSKQPRNFCIMVDRLAAVIRFGNEPLPLPTMRPEPAYEPVKNRVLCLYHMRYPYENNGYVSRSQFLLQSIKSAQFDPHPVTRLGFPNDLARHRATEVPEFESVEGIQYRTLLDPNEGVLRRTVDEYIDAYARRIIELAKDLRPAAIHAASNHLNGLAAIKAARTLGIPSIYEVRGVWEITKASLNEGYNETARYRMERNLENEACRNADHVITISEPVKEFIIENGVEEGRINVIPNGVDSSKIHALAKDTALMKSLEISTDAVVIGFIGSIVHYEGVDIILHAVAKLKAKGRNIVFVLIGDGKELENLKSLATELGIIDICRFTGRVQREEVDRYYSLVDIAPLPRRSLQVTELVPPLKQYEAMAAGKAVIVSNVRALAATVLDGKTGLVMEENTVDGLATKMDEFILDKNKRKEFGDFAQKWVAEHRSIEAIGAKVTESYEAVGMSAGD